MKWDLAISWQLWGHLGSYRSMWQHFELSEIFAIPSSKHYMNYGIAAVSCVDIVPIDHMHMTSQKGAPVVLGVKRGTPRAPSPSMHSEGKPLHASPPSWPGCAHWLRGWAPMRSASKTCARSATSLDPQHGVVVMETWRQCIRSIHIEFFVTIFQERNTANDMWQETVQELDRLAAEHRVCSFHS